MSEVQKTTEYRYVPPPPAPPKRYRARDLIAVVVGAVIIFIAGGVAGAATTTSVPVAAPSPEVRTETQTVEVEVTPSSCLDAIDSAEEIFGYAAAGFTAASQGFESASRFDVSGILAANRQMRVAAGKVGAATPDWRRARNACRASA